ncbi:LOW QUALITY PROTEIN: hypothetical protein PanWU01x14_272420, partial [Parasponia andersonii]
DKLRTYCLLELHNLGIKFPFLIRNIPEDLVLFTYRIQFSD